MTFKLSTLLSLKCFISYSYQKVNFKFVISKFFYQWWNQYLWICCLCLDEINNKNTLIDYPYLWNHSLLNFKSWIFSYKYKIYIKMFEEANRENFEVWTEKLINGGLQNLKIIKDFEWREKHSASNFDLLKRLQQSLDLAEEILISGLCYVKRIANHFLKLNSLSIYK